MNKPRDSFSKFLVLSVGFHAVIFIILTVKVLFFPTETPEFKQAVRVDVVALPDKVEAPPQPVPKKEEPKPVAKKEEPKPVAKKEEPKPEPKPKPKKPKPKTPKPKVKPKIVEKPKPKPKPKKAEKKKEEPKEDVKDEQDSAIARLKAMKKLKEKQEAAAQKQEFKGNAVSRGNSLEGLQKLHHESYLDELDAHIRNYWNLPEWLASGNLKARVLLLISRNGAISNTSFLAKSGNDLFDQHVLSTLEKASPLPAPPSNLTDFYSTKGVEIRFPE